MVIKTQLPHKIRIDFSGVNGTNTFILIYYHPQWTGFPFRVFPANFGFYINGIGIGFCRDAQLGRLYVIVTVAISFAVTVAVMIAIAIVIILRFRALWLCRKHTLHQSFFMSFQLFYFLFLCRYQCIQGWQKFSDFLLFGEGWDCDFYILIQKYKFCKCCTY